MTRRVRIHPATWAFVVVGVLLGHGDLVLILALSLALHELAHVLALEAANGAVAELRVYPFGGALRAAGWPRVPPRVERQVALAGPVQSLALAAVFEALGAVLPPGTRLDLAAQVNLSLGLVNLIPAYPLDGGRILKAWWEERHGRREAVRAALGLARGLGWAAAGAGGVMALVGAFSWWPFLLAAEILVAAAAEARAEDIGVPGSLVLRRRLLREDGTVPVERLAARASLTLADLLRRLSPERWHEVLVLDEELRRAGVLDEETIARAFEAGRLREEIRRLTEPPR